MSFGTDHREAALARFSAVPEPSWPPERVGYQDDREATARGRAHDKIQEGRRLTRANDYAAAIAAFDAALAADPTLAAGHSGRGYARLLAGHLDEAKADLEAALVRDDAPKFQAAVYFNLGQVAERRGDLAAARAAYTRSQQLRPTQATKDALAALPSG